MDEEIILKESEVIKAGTKPKWIAKGSGYDGRRPGHSTPADITIKECLQDIRMPGKDIFGEPVHVRLAVDFIRQFWDKVEHLGIMEKYEKAIEFVNNKDDKLEPGMAEKLLNEFKNDHWFEAFIMLVDLLIHSAGITFGRSVLLKALSQPECTGLRFYLGLKNSGEKSPSLKETFTLVMVGVNSEGHDLNYKLKPHYESKSELLDIENESLCGEYPAPSGLIGTKNPEFNADSPFTLFQYAMKLK